MELDPFPHRCNILDFEVISGDRVLLTCAICKKIIAVMQNFTSFRVKPTEKIYPTDEGARYSEKTIMDLV
jgi:hypothetical protein